MFAFSQLTPRTSGQLTSPGVDLGTYLGATMDQAFHDLAFGTVMRMTEDQIYKEGELLTPEQATARYGIKEQLRFTEPTYAKIAQLRNERKRAEMLRGYYTSEGSTGLFSGRGLLGLGTGLIASVSNPLDLALSFMPVTGSLSRAKNLAATGAAGWRVALAKGLITEEALATRIPAPRLFSAMIDGTVSQAAFEIPLAIQNYRDQANYDVSDFFTNIATGGIFSGAIHLGVEGLTRAMKKIPQVTPETRETMFRQALQQVLTDEPVHVAEYVHLDEVKITAEVDAVLRLKALDSIDLPKLQEEVSARFKERITAAAIKYSDGTVLTGPIHAMIDGPMDPLAREGFVTDKGRFVSREEAQGLTGSAHSAGSEDVIPANKGYEVPGVEKSTITERNAYDALIAAGETPEKATQAVLEMRKSQEAAARDTLLNRPEVQAEIAKVREERVRQFLEQNRPEQLKAARDAEIRQQIAQGKILTSSDALKWGYDTPKDAKAALDEEVANLKDALKTLSPEELKSLDEAGSGFIDKAVDLLQRLKVNQKPGDLHLSLADFPLSVWHGAIDAVIAALKAGQKIAEAIEAGVSHLKLFHTEPQDVNVGSSHYGGVEFGNKLSVEIDNSSKVRGQVGDVANFRRKMLDAADKDPRYAYLYHKTSVPAKKIAAEGLTGKENYVALEDAWSGLDDKTTVKIPLKSIIDRLFPDPENFLEGFPQWKTIKDNSEKIAEALKAVAEEGDGLGDALYVVDGKIDPREIVSVIDNTSGKEFKKLEQSKQSVFSPKMAEGFDNFRETITNAIELERQHLEAEAREIEASNEMPLGSGKKVEPLHTAPESVSKQSTAYVHEAVTHAVTKVDELLASGMPLQDAYFEGAKMLQSYFKVAMRHNEKIFTNGPDWHSIAESGSRSLYEKGEIGFQLRDGTFITADDAARLQIYKAHEYVTLEQDPTAFGGKQKQGMSIMPAPSQPVHLIKKLQNYVEARFAGLSPEEIKLEVAKPDPNRGFADIPNKQKPIDPMKQTEESMTQMINCLLKLQR